MSRRNWKNARATSLVHALRLCKEFAQDRRNLSVERIADLMGASHDMLYKWLGTPVARSVLEANGLQVGGVTNAHLNKLMRDRGLNVQAQRQAAPAQQMRALYPSK